MQILTENYKKECHKNINFEKALLMEDNDQNAANYRYHKGDQKYKVKNNPMVKKDVMGDTSSISSKAKSVRKLNYKGPQLSFGFPEFNRLSLGNSSLANTTNNKSLQFT